MNNTSSQFKEQLTNAIGAITILCTPVLMMYIAELFN